jgi:hypothetical protein
VGKRTNRLRLILSKKSTTTTAVSFVPAVAHQLLGVERCCCVYGSSGTCQHQHSSSSKLFTLNYLPWHAGFTLSCIFLLALQTYVVIHRYPYPISAGIDPAWSGRGGGGGGCSVSSAAELCRSCAPPTHQLAWLLQSLAWLLYLTVRLHPAFTQITVSHFVSNIFFALSWKIAPPLHPLWPGLGGGGGVHPTPQ